jgi:site-specific DNA-methyltransferase (adenine-specific)
MQNLKIQYLKVKDLTPYENNPRDISEDAVAAVAKSIKEFGFKVPVLLDEKGVIIAGHTRKLAAEKLGLEEVPCILINDLSEEQIKAFRIADNKTAEFSAWNEDLLTEELKGLEDLFTGFDENEFNFSQSFLSEREIENSEDLLDKEERVPEVSQVKSSQVKSSQVKS